MSFISHNPNYEYGRVSIVKFAEDDYQIVRSKCTKKKGVKNPDFKLEIKDSEYKRAENNILRAKGMINEIIRCNPFTLFMTLTQDKLKVKDRYSIEEFKIKLHGFIKKVNRTRPSDKKIGYVIVFEQHKDDAWHAHGCFLGLGIDELYKTNKKDKHGRCIYNWLQFQNEIGFTEITKISNKKKTASYMNKYMTKALVNPTFEKGKRMYTVSKGLKRKEVVLSGCDININSAIEGKDSYKNDFCEIWKFEDDAFLQNIVLD